MLFRGDVTSREDCEHAVQAAIDLHGRRHILVNDAGYGMPLKRVGDFEDEDWRSSMSVDLEGPVSMARTCRRAAGRTALQDAGLAEQDDTLGPAGGQRVADLTATLTREDPHGLRGH